MTLIRGAWDSAARDGRPPDLDPFHHELRLVAHRGQLVALLAAAAPHTVREIHDSDRPVSFTRTTYLDTDAFDYLRSSLTGVSRRLRIREYASAPDISTPPTLTGRCFLELKETTDSSRAKLRAEASAADIEALIQSSGTADPACPPSLAQHRQLVEEFARSAVRPCLTTWYRRICLLANDPPLRLTIDEDLVFCLPQALGHAGETVFPRDIIGHGPGRIVEIKWIGEQPPWLVRAVADLEVRPPEHSKFRLGMAALEAIGGGTTEAMPSDDMTVANAR